ncbi:uncharacterized protein LOC133781446 [Humulus lupulus]|uniref:uncharacterized protein LOC133781446 n=1 Tax=Humulus lupulus TaxID=3486 RepID=UPI002B40A123|nr:uncharacterized protein LOC133781446 [Humulus lupulus]
MNKKDKQKAILYVCRVNKVGFGALLETRVKHEKIDEMILNNFPGWDFYSSPVVSGRILLIWHSNLMKVEVIIEDAQFLHYKVKIYGHLEEVFITAVYGSNSLMDRKELWYKLAGIGKLMNPWLIFGDFNAMFNFQDRSGGRLVTAKDIEDAQYWLSLGQVDEFKSSGAYYTWSNKHDVGDHIYSKLDRVFTNELWIDAFPKSEACFKWDPSSDHSYCISCASDCGDLKSIVLKLFRIKHSLKKFYREEVGDVVLRYKEAKEAYCKAQGDLASNPTDLVLQQAELKMQQDYYTILKSYTSWLKQQSKVTWLNDGDENSRYFHAVMKKRRIENRVTTFSVNDRSEKGDVKKALFGIHSIKSPGLDGFGSSFFKGLWEEIGDDVAKAVLGFFQEGRLPSELKETVISLIPKKENPEDANDYRPIACCSTLYKCISKMICTRLAEVLPTLVQSNQGAFIKNRLLAHNILIFHDLLKGYTRKSVSARCFMKIDLSKAYDNVDWQFVEDLLKELCFPSRFIGWILVCLQGTNYNLLMNGRLQGAFKGEKGLRQGDPMSPLLFVLIMEYLTRLLARNTCKKGFGFHPLCKSLKLTNLCFADDLIIFCKGNIKSVEMVNSAFKEFCDTTGLSANKSKSLIYFGWVKAESKKQILDLVQMEEGSFPLKYLGVYLRPTKWKVADCGIILDKLNKKLNSWASRNLSFAGRAQLIHSVLLGIRNFWMSLFILPQKITAAIDKSCRDFLWGAKGNRSKYHLPAWEKVCLPKKFGGVGFREGKKWNIALMAKFFWAISSKEDNLWVKWVNSIYLKEQSFWSLSVKQDMCWYFKKLLKLREIVDMDKLHQAGRGGKFYVKKFYNSLLSVDKVEYAHTVWHKLIVPKHRFIFWQAINSQLLTRDHLGKIMPIPSSCCPVCEIDDETHSHLFMECIFTRKVFGEIENWLGCYFWPRNFIDLQERCSKKLHDLRQLVINAVLAATIYMLWKNRNRCIFYCMSSTIMAISREIKSIVKIRVLGSNNTRVKRVDHYVLNLIESW